jgi:hypothetical protein
LFSVADGFRVHKVSGKKVANLIWRVIRLDSPKHFPSSKLGCVRVRRLHVRSRYNRSIRSGRQKGLSEAYSIRESLQGALQDFVRDSGFTCVHLEGLIRELVGLLASYREEDAPLYPEVFVSSSPDTLTALAPAGSQITVAVAALTSESASIILKNCAPLAAEGWAIFVVKENNQIRYGLFRSVRHSLSTAAEESMRDLGNEAPIVLIRNRGRLVVELSNTLDKRFTVALTTTPAQPSRLETDVRAFVDVVSSRVEDSSRFRSYLGGFLTQILQDCHGTLLAAIDADATNLGDSTLADAVWPMPRLSLSQLHARALETGTADSLADLQGAETLIAGMVNSDGVVLFGTNGALLAYRLFLKPTDSEKTYIPEKGGGRRRTFELMTIRLQNIFKAVLFRSQDGDTICRRSNP